MIGNVLKRYGRRTWPPATFSERIVYRWYQFLLFTQWLPIFLRLYKRGYGVRRVADISRVIYFIEGGFYDGPQRKDQKPR